MIYVISGPSGCGKSTLIQRVRKRLENVQFAVSHTTRKKRENEKEGKDYYFMSQEEFERMTRQGRFIERALVHGNYYGTSKKEVDAKGTKGDLLLDIDVQGAQQIKAKSKRVAFIFILPPSFQELKRRLEVRGLESPDSIRKRLEVARREIRYYSQFDYLIVNDQLEKAVRELESILISSRCRFDSRKREIRSILQSFSEDL
jgi:guanylate kinase